MLRIKSSSCLDERRRERIGETARGVGEVPAYDEVIVFVAMVRRRRKRGLWKRTMWHAPGLPVSGTNAWSGGGTAGTIWRRRRRSASRGRRYQAMRASRAYHAMIALATVGNADELAAVERRLDHAYPLSVFNMGFYRPVAEGLLSAARHEPAERVKAMMAPALPYELGQIADLIPLYARGQALLDTGAVADAQHEFQKLLDHREVDPLLLTFRWRTWGWVVPSISRGKGIQAARSTASSCGCGLMRTRRFLFFAKQNRKPERNTARLLIDAASLLT